MTPRCRLEFPRGPYVAKTNFILASFYDDLAKVIAALIENEKENKDYKYDCFLSYLTKDPYPIQLNKAKASALEYLDKVLVLTPESERKNMLLEYWYVNSGETFSWHWCAD